MDRQATILGLSKLQRKLDRLPKVAKDHIRSEMGKAADEIVAMMKRQVAVDDGTLRDSIGWTWGKAPAGSVIVAAMKGAGIGGDLTITIYAGSREAYYARFVEFGTKNMDAQPYFYVSWRSNRKEARKSVRKAVRDAARQVAAQN